MLYFIIGIIVIEFISALVVGKHVSKTIYRPLTPEEQRRHNERLRKEREYKEYIHNLSPEQIISNLRHASEIAEQQQALQTQEHIQTHLQASTGIEFGGNNTDPNLNLSFNQPDFPPPPPPDFSSMNNFGF